MIRLLRHHEIDRARWDRCVKGSECPMVYAFSWYLDMVSPGWYGLVLDDYRGVFPLTHRKKFGIRYIHQPAFTQQLGCFGEGNADDFIEAIPKEFRLIELQLNHSNTSSNPEAERRPDLVLSLDQELDPIRKDYSENTKRNIRKARSNGIFFEKTLPVKSLIALFREHRGRTITSMKAHDYSLLEKICSKASKRESLEILSAHHPDYGLQAGAVFLKSPHGWIFLFSAVHPSGRSTGAMSALIDHFIAGHIGEKGVLDFEGSTDPDLYRFYKSFGSTENVYLRIRINRLPFPLNLLKRPL